MTNKPDTYVRFLHCQEAEFNFPYKFSLPSGITYVSLSYLLPSSRKEEDSFHLISLLLHLPHKYISLLGFTFPEATYTMPAPSDRHPEEAAKAYAGLHLQPHEKISPNSFRPSAHVHASEQPVNVPSK